MTPLLDTVMSVKQFQLTGGLLRPDNPSDWNCSTTGLEG